MGTSHGISLVMGTSHGFLWSWEPVMGTSHVKDFLVMGCPCDMFPLSIARHGRLRTMRQGETNGIKGGLSC